MEDSKEKNKIVKQFTENKTFSVPFYLEEINENITFITETSSKQSQEKIFKKAITFQREGNVAQAAKYYEYFLDQGFEDSRVYSNYGIILRDLGKLKEAEIYYKKAIKLNPNFSNAYLNLGNLLKDIGKLKEAEIYYKKAIKLNPNFSYAYLNLGVTLKRLGKLEDAVKSYRKVIKINPNIVEAHTNLGSILRSLGKYQEAELSFSEAIKIKPDYAIAHYNLGNVLGDCGRLQDAEKCFRKAIELKSDFAIAHYNLGMMLINLGNSNEAESSLRKAIELEPDLTCAVEQLGRHLYLNRKFNLAIEYLSKNKSDSCQSLYLSCLLCLDKEKAFNKKYNEISQKKICNADMSGIIEHANIIYEKKNDSYFCNEAIKYIFMEKINEELFSATHFDQLLSYLKSDELKTKPQSLIHKATQSTGNLFLLNYPFIKSLKKALEIKIELYKARFKDSEQGFIKNWPKEYTLRSWILSMKTGGFIKPHNHRYGWITGSFYLQVPKCNKNDNSGNISFSYQGPEYPTKGKKFDSTIKKIENRDICIFPSSLFHHTIPFKSTEERICLVFDLGKKNKN